jgi:hypothetical protein
VSLLVTVSSLQNRNYCLGYQSCAVILFVILIIPTVERGSFLRCNFQEKYYLVAASVCSLADFGGTQQVIDIGCFFIFFWYSSVPPHFYQFG